MNYDAMNKINMPNLDKFPHLKEFFGKKDKFILDENNNVLPATTFEWATFLETPPDRRRVGRHEVNGYLISTVFLGLDHNIMIRIPHELHIFETMIFKDDKREVDYCERYSTWQEAEEGHKRAVEWVKNGCKEVE